MQHIWSEPQIESGDRGQLTSSDARRNLVKVFDVACILMDERLGVDFNGSCSRLLIGGFYHEDSEFAN